MALKPGNVALIVGTGPGLSASLARNFTTAGLKVGLAARNTDKLADLVRETGASPFRCDTTDTDAVSQLFTDVAAQLGTPDIVVFNASARARGPITELDPENVRQVLAVSPFGAFLVGQAAAKAMTPRGSGVIIFTGASASIKGFANSSSFAMAKFAVRGLAQSMARELGPKGIHVAHVIVDGGIRSAVNPNPADQPDSRLDPDAIADAYLHLAAQERSAWTQELDLRPWSERF